MSEREVDLDMILVPSTPDDASSSSKDDPRPSKRRRFNRVASFSSEDSAEEADNIDEHNLPSPACEVGKTAHHNDEETAHNARIKRFIHAPEFEANYENTFVTQLTQQHSSPSRIRGPRWKKPAPAPTPVPNRFERLVSPPLPPPAAPLSDNHNDAFDDDSAWLEAFFPASEAEQRGKSEAVALERADKVVQRSQHPTTYRQTTLLGQIAAPRSPSGPQSTAHNWPLSSKIESPTHHKLDHEALATWVYPMNIGKTRDYQFNIVQRGLFHNLLIALPTGLGKTFIAATVMLNWYRWTREAQIVFVAPTKPLVSQQIDACFGIAGIPRSQTTMLTGNVQPALRAEEWQTKRVFFMTPQTLVHDLKTGICDPKKIVLLVVDEAHRATGNYAYVEIVRFLRRFNTSFRVLALTATPGKDVPTVQTVIDGLDIARTEIRTEESLDIRDFVYQRNVVTEVFDNTDELDMLIDLFSKALQPVLNKLVGQITYLGKDPLRLTPYGLDQARKKWMMSDAGRKASHGLKAMVNTIINVLASLASALQLLMYHGAGPFYRKAKDFEEATWDGSKNNKYAKQVATDEHFKKLMNRLNGWINDPDFVGHPKLSYLRTVVLNHFMDAGHGRGGAGGRPPSDTRIMVFVQFRDSAEEVTRVLRRHEPMIRPHVFVGQSTTKGSEGMDQKKQLDIIEKFKKGIYNTIVATSIGEEGLDIGEVDLIVCYDSQASPIRMLQRIGRTGRKRAGNIVLLMMRGKEEAKYASSKDSYEVMQRKIASGKEFNYHDDRSPRIIPKEFIPVADKRHVEIPVENTQSDPPEPKKRGRVGKKPAKKFHMPDGVETGFQFLGNPTKAGKRSEELEVRTPRSLLDQEIAVPPALSDIILSKEDETQLELRYRNVGGTEVQYVCHARLDAFPRLQRQLRPTHTIGHSRLTHNLVKAFADMQDPNRYSRLPRNSDYTLGNLTSPTSKPGKTVLPRRTETPSNDTTTPSSVTVGPVEEECDDGLAIRRDGKDEDPNSDDLTGRSVLGLRALSTKTPEEEMPFYLSQKTISDNDDLENELPDVANVVSASKSSRAGRLVHSKQSSKRRVRGKRRIFDDDDDDGDSDS